MANALNAQQRRVWVLEALEKYECRLTRYAIRLIGDEEVARDAVQHAFLRLCDAVPEEITDHLAPWLYTVCRNKTIDAFRAEGRVEPLGGAAADQLAGRETDPALIAESRDLSTWLRHLLDALPGGQREVMDLHLEGFSYAEIAEITGRTAGSTRVTAHRAITLLRAHPQVRELLDDPTQTTSRGPARPKQTERARS